jgi:hypothetical protein
LLIASVLANIGMLAFFKYFNFANENLAALANFIGWNYPIENLEILLPIGLSFHTFQSLSYTIEVYRGNQKAERHLVLSAARGGSHRETAEYSASTARRTSLRIPARRRRIEVDGLGHVQKSRDRRSYGFVRQPCLRLSHWE